MSVQVFEVSSPIEASSTIAAGLFARHRRNLLLIARLHSGSADDAEEALQDALILFIENYDPTSGAPPLAWLTLYADPRVMPTYLSRVGSEADRGLVRSA